MRQGVTLYFFDVWRIGLFTLPSAVCRPGRRGRRCSSTSSVSCTATVLTRMSGRSAVRSNRTSCSLFRTSRSLSFEPRALSLSNFVLSLLNLVLTLSNCVLSITHGVDHSDDSVLSAGSRSYASTKLHHSLTHVTHVIILTGVAEQQSLSSNRR